MAETLVCGPNAPAIAQGLGLLHGWDVAIIRPLQLVDLPSCRTLIAETSVLGPQYVKHIRMNRTNPLAIVMIGARSPQMVREYLEAGADQYLESPVDARLLAASTQAVIDGFGRNKTNFAPDYTFGSQIEISLSAPYFRVDGDNIAHKFTRMEWSILEVLVRRSPRPVHAMSILDAIPHNGSDVKIIDVMIHRIRRKLSGFGVDRSWIATQWRIGYSVAAPDSPIVKDNNYPVTAGKTHTQRMLEL